MPPHAPIADASALIQCDELPRSAATGPAQSIGQTDAGALAVACLPVYPGSPRGVARPRGPADRTLTVVDVARRMI